MKEAHQAKVEAQLHEWRAKLDVLHAKTERATAEARIELGKHLGELKELEAAGRKHLDQLATATSDAWDDVKAGAEEKWTQLSAASAVLWAKLK